MPVIDIIKETVTEENYVKYLQWYSHDCPFKNDSGAIGGRISFTLTPTGLGDIIVAQCACGEKIDLSDYDEW